MIHHHTAKKERWWFQLAAAKFCHRWLHFFRCHSWYFFWAACLTPSSPSALFFTTSIRRRYVQLHTILIAPGWFENNNWHFFPSSWEFICIVLSIKKIALFSPLIVVIARNLEICFIRSPIYCTSVLFLKSRILILQRQWHFYDCCQLQLWWRPPLRWDLWIILPFRLILLLSPPLLLRNRPRPCLFRHGVPRALRTHKAGVPWNVKISNKTFRPI